MHEKRRRTADCPSNDCHPYTPQKNQRDSSLQHLFHAQSYTYPPYLAIPKSINQSTTSMSERGQRYQLLT